MVTECKKALIKTYIGIALQLVSLALLYFGRTENFGYLDTDLAIVFVLFLILMVVGSILAISYIQCLEHINRKPGSRD